MDLLPAAGLVVSLGVSNAWASRVRSRLGADTVWGSSALRLVTVVVAVGCIALRVPTGVAFAATGAALVCSQAAMWLDTWRRRGPRSGAFIETGGWVVGLAAAFVMWRAG